MGGRLTQLLLALSPLVIVAALAALSAFIEAECEVLQSLRWSCPAGLPDWVGAFQVRLGIILYSAYAWFIAVVLIRGLGRVPQPLRHPGAER